LVSKGIDSKRLEHKGYGSSQPINTDAEIAALPETEQSAAHQENRRVEYKIISK